MKLITFHHSGRGDRVGAVAADGSFVDLNSAYALYLRNVECEGAFYALADARVPADMRGLFENGDRGLDAARAALEYALKEGPGTEGPSGETILFRRDAVRIKAPILPKKFFHTAGNFREHHTEAQKAGFSHPVLPWIVFFQNVDAIIGPDEEIVYPEHLTEELDYELELAVVTAPAITLAGM
jgi:2-keto-4-pentenoate hydratase/2-oxohepta-3-ene-1,7-dioic acid hydratase in catechol pathway